MPLLVNVTAILLGRAAAAPKISTMNTDCANAYCGCGEAKTGVELRRTTPMYDDEYGTVATEVGGAPHRPALEEFSVK